jgi:hypothetical protein
MWTLQFKCVENITSKKEIDIGFMSRNENEGAVLLVIMVCEFLEENLVNDDFFEYPFEDLVQKPGYHPNDFEIVGCENVITD